MRTQAAVLYAAGTDWKVQDIELDPPRAGEVLVRVAAAGLCHSDEHHRSGDVPFAGPMVGGHEGAGFVEQIGPGVTLVKPGDSIVFSSIPNCGRCPSCVIGRQNLCDGAAGIMAGRQILDGSSRHRSLANQDLTITRSTRWSSSARRRSGSARRAPRAAWRRPST
jgi:Zn-dependent alcohol dehydrogenase